jgi:hypothetical protein
MPTIDRRELFYLWLSYDPDFRNGFRDHDSVGNPIDGYRHLVQLRIDSGLERRAPNVTQPANP